MQHPQVMYTSVETLHSLTTRLFGVMVEEYMQKITAMCTSAGTQLSLATQLVVMVEESMQGPVSLAMCTSISAGTQLSLVIQLKMVEESMQSLYKYLM